VISGKARGSSLDGIPSGPTGSEIVPVTSFTTRFEPPGAPLDTKSWAEKNCLR
jgi:hypothetical protein